MATSATTPTVIVGYDGSDGARAAVRYAASRLAGTGRVIAVCAIHPSSSWASAGAGLSGTSDSEAARHKARADAVLATLDELDLGGVSVEKVPGDGNPADIILRVAEEQAASEIVVGGGRRRGLSRRRLVNALLAGAACPVVVV